MRIFSGTANASSNPRGWRSPTTAQPVFASFYNTAFAGNNLANTAAAAQVVGAPVLTSGVVGSALPYLTTQGAVNYLATGLPETPAGTILAIARMRTPPTDSSTDGVIVGNFDNASGNTMLIFTVGNAPAGAIRGRSPMSSPAGFNASPPLIADMKNWAIYALRWDCSTTGGASSATVQSVTQGSVTKKSGTGVSATIGKIPLYIGSQPSADGVYLQGGVIDHAHTSIFDYALTDDELADTARLLRNYASMFGVAI